MKRTATGRAVTLALCAVCASLALPAIASAAAPANDDFANAVVLTGAATSVTGSNVDATTEVGEPVHLYSGSNGHSAWWRWTAPFGGTVTIDLCGSAYDTVMVVYTGSALNALTAVAENDDSCVFASAVTFDITRGTEYRIAVDGFDGDAAAIALNLAAVSTDPTANDDARTVVEDSGATSLDVLANDALPVVAEPVRDVLRGIEITAVSDPANGTATLVPGSSPARRPPSSPDQISYTPDANYCNDPGAAPTDDFTYTVNGGDTATVAVTVRCVADGSPAAPPPPPPVALPTCMGKTATIVPTAGQKTITGTNGADVIVASAANETINGLGGNDTICAGKGNDTVRGGAGNDKLQADKGNDHVFGGAGRDLLLGGGGDDIMHGGSGNDRLGGSGGDDHVYGDAGNDRLDEQAFGGLGADHLYGGSGNDRVRTAGGTPDRINCGRGRDRVFMDVTDSQRRCENVTRAASS